MNARLYLHGSNAAINAVLAAAAANSVTIGSIELSCGDGDTLDGLTLGEGNAQQVASTSTGTGTAAPTPIPSAPTLAAPTPPAPTPTNGSDDDGEEGDDSGPAGDGLGVDADGLPWDERIHSSNRKQSANGKWMKRRGGPSGAELAAIEAELRGAAAPAAVPPMPTATAEPAPAPVMAPPPPLPTAPPAPLAPPATAAVEPLPTPAIAAPAAPVAPPAPMVAAPTPMPTAAPAADEQSWDFASLMQAIGPKMGEGEGQINAAYLATVCAAYGLSSITDLAMKPETIPQIVAQFQVDGRW